MATRNRWRNLIPLLILWPAFGLRLYRLDFQSIWWDEGHSIFVAGQPIVQIPTLPAMDVHPPAYFILLHGWLAVAGRSEFALRYLSVIFSLLTIALLWRFAAHIQQLSISNLQSPPSSAPLLTTLLTALSPLYVAYAQEVRGYAMITFLALTSTYSLWYILFRRSTAAGVIIYIVSTAACLYTHYFTIFLLLFQNLAWPVWVVRGQWLVISGQSAVISDRSTVSSQQWSTTGGRRSHREASHSAVGSRLALWFISQAGILLLFTPQLLLAFRQVTGYTNPNLSPPSLIDFISRSWQAYTIGLTLDPTPARWGMALLLAILLTAWLRLLIQIRSLRTQNSKLLTQNLLFFAAWFLLPLAAYFVVLQRQPSFEPRYMMLVTPALFLLLGLGLGQVASGQWQVASSKVAGNRVAGSPKPSTPRSPLSALHSPLSAFRFTLPALTLIVFIISLHSYYTNQTYFKDDSAGVADWLANETTANDIVYIDVPHPFHYYAERIPAPTRYLFVDIHTAADILTREAAGRDRLFWVTWRGSDTDPRQVIPFLAEKYGQSLGRRDFRGYQIAWYSLPPAGTTFSLPNTLTPVQVTFGDVLRLDGLAYGGQPPQDPTLRAGESGWVTLHFTLLRETEVDYRVSLRLRREDGQQVAQVDKDLLNDRHFRTSAWPLADPALNQALNVYTLPVPTETPPGDYRLEAVIYNAQPPYPSEGVTGQESSNDGVAAILGPLTVLP